VDNSIVIDILAYRNADVYTKYTFVDFLISDEPWPAESIFARFRLSGSDIQLSYLTGTKFKFTTWEFPQINHRFGKKDYTYVYSLVNALDADSGISKLNVKTSEVIDWYPGDGIFVGEPVYVDRPSASAEDDGVLLVGVLNSKLKQSGVFVLDAKDLSVLGSAYGPDVVPFGFHNRFYTFDELGVSTDGASNKSEL